MLEQIINMIKEYIQAVKNVTYSRILEYDKNTSDLW
jgi:hypothetical protein